MDLKEIYRMGYIIGVFMTQLDAIKKRMLNQRNLERLKKDWLVGRKVLDEGLTILSSMLKTESILSDTCIEIEYYSGKLMVDFNYNNKFLSVQIKSLLDNLEKKVVVWRERIQRELGSIKVAKLIAESNLNLERIALGANSFFEEEIWNKFNEIEKKDLMDGCRCISLQAWTPASMIIMRAVESSLRTYFKFITGDNPPTDKTMGYFIEQLRKNQNSNRKLVEYFDYLKTFRNILQHPDARFTQFQAEDIFNNAIHIFNQVYNTDLKV